jgi:hypothetical protein
VFDTPPTSAPATNNGAPSADTAPSAPVADQAAAPAPAQDSTQQKPAEAPAVAAPAEAPQAKTEGEQKPEALTPEMYAAAMPDMSADFVKGLSEAAIANSVKPEAMKAMVDAHAATIKAQQEQWSVASANDPLIGGEKMEEKLAVAIKGLKAFGDDEVNALLKTTPLGTHPAILRLLYRAGQTVQEDRHVNSGGAPAGTRSAAEILFGSN